MAKTYYKVVSVKDNGELCSYYGDFLPEPFRVIYIPGQYVYPNVKGTNLFVCKTLEDAKSWEAIDTEVWECHVKHPMNKGIHEYCFDSWNYWTQIIVKFLLRKQRHKKFAVAKANMVFCSAVKLTKRLSNV